MHVTFGFINCISTDINGIRMCQKGICNLNTNAYDLYINICINCMLLSRPPKRGGAQLWILSTPLVP